jgi:hypothetical protein
MQYRIVKRQDFITEKFYYHIERRNDSWNNWEEIGFRCISEDSVNKQLQTYLKEKETLKIT